MMSKMFWQARFHKNFPPELLERMECLNLGELSKDNKLFKKIKTKCGEVSRELWGMKQYTRLEPLPERILWSELGCEHEIQELLLDFFMEKFPTYVIVLVQEGKAWVGSKVLGWKRVERFAPGFWKRFRAVCAQELDDKGLEMVEVQGFEGCWEAYYDSQITGRESSHSLNVEKEFLERTGNHHVVQRIDGDSFNARLDDFLGGEELVTLH